jgi:signal transduction histidine kinase
MDFNLITNVESCFLAVKENPPLLFYSHIPTATISLFVGCFVFLKNRKLLASKILFAISITFSLWTFLNLIIWTSYDDRIIMLTWSLLGILGSLLCIFSLYFEYVFIDKKDITLFVKIILGLMLLPVIVSTGTKFNLSLFDLANCEASEGKYFNYYYYLIGFLVSFWILILAFIKYKKAEQNFKKQIIYLTVGIELFLLSFFATGFFASYLAEKGVAYSFEIEQYGLFGMTFFMGFLAYLIVRYKAFDIKLLGSQALVVAINILIASQFFFIRTSTNQVLTGITLLLSMLGGWILIKSVKLEVQRKEELQLMTTKLAQANDQLRKLDNAKSEFISIASHQLRTPLTAIKGFISLLLEGAYGKVDAVHRDILNKVYSSNERLITLVEDMLNLSRIEAGRMEYNLEKVRVENIIQEVYDTFIIRARDKKISLDIIYPDYQPPEITTDKSKIREVISNLVDNAVKYTISGSVTIKLTKEEKDGYLRVAVTDSGIGIPQDELPYLFAKFSRGHDTTRLNTGGTGLGLHVGKLIIEALRGKIWAESKGKDKGSTFFIELPLKAPTEVG